MLVMYNSWDWFDGPLQRSLKELAKAPLLKLASWERARFYPKTAALLKWSYRVLSFLPIFLAKTIAFPIDNVILAPLVFLRALWRAVKGGDNFKPLPGGKMIGGEWVVKLPPSAAVRSKSFVLATEDAAQTRYQSMKQVLAALEAKSNALEVDDAIVELKTHSAAEADTHCLKKALSKADCWMGQLFSAEGRAALRACGSGEVRLRDADKNAFNLYKMLKFMLFPGEVAEAARAAIPEATLKDALGATVRTLRSVTSAG
ncbi:MAG: hypothetical protein DHS20C10_12520 [marine bacterium B5-7]|nr:MAG: hypothetical protein DHS20C10_12520 [marine bacterium B5-7]